MSLTTVFYISMRYLREFRQFLHEWFLKHIVLSKNICMPIEISLIYVNKAQLAMSYHLFRSIRLRGIYDYMVFHLFSNDLFFLLMDMLNCLGLCYNVKINKVIFNSSLSTDWSRVISSNDMSTLWWWWWLGVVSYIALNCWKRVEPSQPFN